MFGFSFSELVVICVVALLAVGPQKLPGMLRTLGEWIRKLRNLTYEMRTQSGIDDILRAEGLHGGLNELRGLMRGPHLPAVYQPTPADPAPAPAPAPVLDPYANLEIDATKEYPPEGPDAYGALPDDLVDESAFEAVTAQAALESPKPPAAALESPEPASARAEAKPKPAEPEPKPADETAPASSVSS